MGEATTTGNQIVIFFLRNISIRLWISVGISIPLTFMIFPAIQHLIPDIGARYFCIIVTGLVLILTGYIMNVAGERSIYRCINEAKNWERDGIFYKSEICYLKALQLFDSYLLTFLTSKKIAISLTGAIAKFSLTAKCYNDHFDNSTIFFLQNNPHKTEVGYLWLKKMVKRISITSSYHEVYSDANFSSASPQDNLLTQLEGNPASQVKNLFNQKEESLFSTFAEIEPLSPKLVPLLAAIFARTQRADFAAKRVFSILEIEDEIVKQPEKISSLPIETEETQESALTTFIYRPRSYRPFSSGRSARRNMQPFIQFSMLSTARSVSLWLLSVTVKGIAWTASLPMNAISFIVEMVKLFFRRVIRSFRILRSSIALHPQPGNTIRRFVVLTVVTGVVMLSVNTVSHLFHTPEPPVPSTPKTVTEDVESHVVPQKKFTIQVAAYLIKSHAEQYLENLEKRGVDQGTIASVEGGGKIWYLIRVGKYETKESAREYGNKLKSQGFVNDFFVDNSG